MPYSTFMRGGTATHLRGLAWLSLTDSALFLRGSATDDGGGGASFTWGTATVWGTAQAVPCRLDPIGSGEAEQVFGGQLDERSTHRLRLPAGAAVAATDRVLVQGRGTWEVTALLQRTNEWSRVAEVVGT